MLLPRLLHLMLLPQLLHLMLLPQLLHLMLLPLLLWDLILCTLLVSFLDPLTQPSVLNVMLMLRLRLMLIYMVLPLPPYQLPLLLLLDVRLLPEIFVGMLLSRSQALLPSPSVSMYPTVLTYPVLSVRLLPGLLHTSSVTLSLRQLAIPPLPQSLRPDVSPCLALGD